MAGREKLAALIEAIERDAAEGGYESGEEYIAARLEAGETPREVMDTYGFSRTMFYHWLNSAGPRGSAERERRKKLLRDARRDAGYAWLDRASDELDRPSPDLDGRYDAAHVSLAKARADHARTMAGIFDPSLSDRGAALNVTVKVEQLHLDALRVAGLPAPQQELMPVEIEE